MEPLGRAAAGRKPTPRCRKTPREAPGSSLRDSSGYLSTVITMRARCRFPDPMAAPSTDLPIRLDREACASGKGACGIEGRSQARGTTGTAAHSHTVSRATCRGQRLSSFSNPSRSTARRRGTAGRPRRGGRDPTEPPPDRGTLRKRALPTSRRPPRNGSRLSLGSARPRRRVYAVPASASACPSRVLLSPSCGRLA